MFITKKDARCSNVQGPMKLRIHYKPYKASTYAVQMVVFCLEFVLSPKSKTKTRHFNICFDLTSEKSPEIIQVYVPQLSNLNGSFKYNNKPPYQLNLNLYRSKSARFELTINVYPATANRNGPCDLKPIHASLLYACPTEVSSLQYR